MAHPHQHTKVTSGVREPSTHQTTSKKSAVQCVARLLGRARTNTSIGNLTQRVPPTLCGKCHKASSRPTPCRAPGRTQIPEVRVRSSGFHPHLSLIETPGPGDLVSRSGSVGIFTSTSRPCPNSTNLVPQRFVLVRPSHASTWTSDSPR